MRTRLLFLATLTLSLLASAVAQQPPLAGKADAAGRSGGEHSRGGRHGRATAIHFQQAVALRGNRALATGKKRSERVYAVTSLTSNKASAKELLEVARKHWKIENGLHYRRDRRLGDYCGFRIAEPGQAM